jgi:hypothetical protein
MRWTRWCRRTSDIKADGEVVWSWRPLAGVKLATMLCIAPMTVTEKSWTPGRARRKPLKPSRRECRRKRRTCGDYARVLFPFAREAMGAICVPGIPCALCLFEGSLHQLGRISAAGMLGCVWLFENLEAAGRIVRTAVPLG